MKKRIIALSLLLTLIIASGFGCKKVDQAAQDAMAPITLEYWRVLDGEDGFGEIIANYNKLHPFITINYRKLRLEEYEDALLNAFAEDKGPDIFSINNTWMRKYQSKLVPMPTEISMAYPVVQKGIQDTVVPELRITKGLTVSDVKNNFADVVASDVVLDNQIYGLPLSVDTLALYYNRDLFNNAGLTDIPQYWNREFQQTVKSLTKQDLKGNLLQSGVALGSINNIDRFSDILALVMMQNGAQMVTADDPAVAFQLAPEGNQDYHPGKAALKFFLDFSDPTKEVYSWKADMQNNVDAFTSGKLAMMFGYAYHLPLITARAPKLNFGIAKMPQIEGATVPVNFANYWVEVVSKKSTHQKEAWDFVMFATNQEQAKSYLKATTKPAALRTLIKDQRQDEKIGIFTDQVLTAKSWYHGFNVRVAEIALAEMIGNCIIDPERIQDYMNLAATKIQETLQGYNQ